MSNILGCEDSIVILSDLRRKSKMRSLPKSAKGSSGRKTTCTTTSTRKTR